MKNTKQLLLLIVFVLLITFVAYTLVTYAPELAGVAQWMVWSG
jgi:ABC-type antimicrobial peptide transport system permease subunit